MARPVASGQVCPILSRHQMSDQLVCISVSMHDNVRCQLHENHKIMAEFAGFLKCYRQMSDIYNDFRFAIRYHSMYCRIGDL